MSKQTSDPTPHRPLGHHSSRVTYYTDLPQPFSVRDTDSAPQLNLITIPTVRRPWGKEIWWANTDKYCLKSLVVMPGESLPVHMHYEKDEIIMLDWHGKEYADIDNPPYLMIFDKEKREPCKASLRLHGDQIRIPKRTFHSFVNTTMDTIELIEVSTTHEESDVMFTEDNPQHFSWPEVEQLLKAEDIVLGTNTE